MAKKKTPSSDEQVSIPGVDPMTREPDRQGDQLPGSTMYVVYRWDGPNKSAGEKK